MGYLDLGLQTSLSFIAGFRKIPTQKNGVKMSDTATLITVLVVALIIFIVCREFTCWYFKINKTVELLEEIRDSLKNKP